MDVLSFVGEAVGVRGRSVAEGNRVPSAWLVCLNWSVDSQLASVADAVGGGGDGENGACWAVLESGAGPHALATTEAAATNRVIFARIGSPTRRPNGLELSCPAEAGRPSSLYGTPAGQASNTEFAARRVSFSELLGGAYPRMERPAARDDTHRSA